MKIRFEIILVTLVGELLATTKRTVAAKPAAQIHGMTISCPMNGEIWGTSAMRIAIRENRRLGVNMIAIHPYARIRKNGEVRFRPAVKLEYLGKAVQIAKAESMPIFWKPHLAYWGSFKWRGAITFKTEREWQRFFRSYEAWILDHAKFAESAKLPLFAIGTELGQTVHRKEWQGIIKKIRQIYKGQLSYAANWDNFGKVPFWKGLDLIGIQAYFPVLSANTPVTAISVSAHWKQLLSTLKTYSQSQGRPIIFTELGYTRSTAAAEKPWDPAAKGDAKQGRQIQHLLLAGALKAIDDVEFIRGLFLWKWIPGFAPWERDFSMRDPEISTVIRATWTR